MEKNPFSLYDFLGYLFPGLLSLLAIRYFVYTSCDDYFSIKSFPVIFKWNNSIDKWELIALFVILSYVAGHIISYLSSVIIEYFATRSFGYPSAYLLKKDNNNGHCFLFGKYFDTKKIATIIKWRRIFLILIKKRNVRVISIQAHRKSIKKGNRKVLLITRIVIAIVMLPVSCALLFLRYDMLWPQFIMKPLDRALIESINKVQKQLAIKLGMTEEKGDETDFHRVVMHYVYLHIEPCRRKTDNYIALYGFLRTMTLISCLIFDFLSIQQIDTIIRIGKTGVINSTAVVVLIVLFFMCNVLFMGFMKFYRRFTLENYMTLLTNGVTQ